MSRYILVFVHSALSVPENQHRHTFDHNQVFLSFRNRITTGSDDKPGQNRRKKPPLIDEAQI